MDLIRTNIRHLMAGRSVKVVGDESEVGQSWLQRFLNPNRPNGIHKPNAEKMAQLAGYFGVQVSELMHLDLTKKPALTNTPGQSQPTRLDPQKVREAHESVRAIYELEGKVYDIEAEPDLFATVYEHLVQITGRPSIAEMTRIGRAIEERQQGGVNGRDEGPERAGVAHSEKGKKSA